ncbi:MAG: hypothetical protein JWQ88_3876 [Rhodoferax sp.]|nr:hypothetical protein [Rhodoferax sp.]
MSATHVADHDRILLRINTTQGTEMQLWLTRRLMLGLWPALRQAVLQPGHDPVGAAPSPNAAATVLKAEFAHAAQLRKSDFSQPYAAPAEALPADAAPLLVGEVELAATSLDGGLRLHLREMPTPGRPQRGYQIELAPQLGHGLVRLLEQALGQAQWGLPDVFSQPQRPATDLAGLDFALGEERPRYLN